MKSADKQEQEEIVLLSGDCWLRGRPTPAPQDVVGII